ncbi:MAG: hypothetical protein ACRD1Z_03420, partial [Vicinamibacteria bacterium]
MLPSRLETKKRWRPSRDQLGLQSSEAPSVTGKVSPSAHPQNPELSDLVVEIDSLHIGEEALIRGPGKIGRLVHDDVQWNTLRFPGLEG